MAVTASEKRVIEKFLTTYNAFNGIEMKVIAWPDEIDRSGKAIDAIASDGQKTVAIEHTLLQPFAGERGDSAIFLHTVGSLDQKPTLQLPDYSVTLTVAVGAVPKGQDWTAVAPAIETWYHGSATTLPDGHSDHVVPGLAFPLEVHIEKVVVPGRADFFISRWMPPGTLDAVVGKAITDKLPKLLAARTYQHLLLLEKNSIARGYGEITEALRGIEAAGTDLDDVEIWVIDTVALESENYGPSYLVWPEDDADAFDAYRHAKDD